MTDRFIVKEWNEGDNWGWTVVDTATGEDVGSDGGEPEDQLLIRNWKWVPIALNKVNAEKAELIAALKDACNGLCALCHECEGAQVICEQSPSCFEREQWWLTAIANATHTVSPAKESVR